VVNVAVIRQKAAREGGWNKFVLPIIYAEYGLEIGQGDEGVQKSIQRPVFIFLMERVSPFQHSKNRTNPQNKEKMKRFTKSLTSL
jgi:hypothetical protein